MLGISSEIREIVFEILTDFAVKLYSHRRNVHTRRNWKVKMNGKRVYLFTCASVLLFTIQNADIIFPIIHIKY